MSTERTESLAGRLFQRGAGLRLLQFGLLVAQVSLLVTSCGRHFDNSNLSAVNREFDLADKSGKGGVSPKEVESILGPPKRVETSHLALETQKKELEVIRYYYEQDGQTVELHFVDNKLISKAPLLNAPAVQPPEKTTP